jgi:hypothetical protein
VQIARRHQLVVCAGLSEKERDIVYTGRQSFGNLSSAVLKR